MKKEKPQREKSLLSLEYLIKPVIDGFNLKCFGDKND